MGIALTDETKLIEMALEGDLNAFNRLVTNHQDAAFNTAMRMLGDPYLADDATQCAFVSAYKSLKTFRGGSFKAWVLRMVINACYDELRRQKRRPTVPLEPVGEDGEDEIESPAWIADDAMSPEDQVANRELEQAIRHCLTTIGEDFRAVVVLVDVQGMDYAEVAESLKIPLGTIKSRLARARLKLQDCLRRFRELMPSFVRLTSKETEE